MFSSWAPKFWSRASFGRWAGVALSKVGPQNRGYCWRCYEHGMKSPRGLGQKLANKLFWKQFLFRFTIFLSRSKCVHMKFFTRSADKALNICPIRVFDFFPINRVYDWDCSYNRVTEYTVVDKINETRSFNDKHSLG
jgi:hypothetical protein